MTFPGTARSGTSLPEPTSLEDEGDVIAAQLGRPLRAVSKPLARCHLGLPIVVEVPPVLDDGTPFPTRYWLSCPLAVRRISRIESGGEIARMDARTDEDPEFGRRLTAAHLRHRVERDGQVPEEAVHRPSGGVAGAAAGIKCLHAHYADQVAGCQSSPLWDNPVGEIVAAEIEPLNCTVPCVVDGRRNPNWIEPTIRVDESS